MADQREVLKSLLVKLNATGLAKRDQVLYDFLRNLFVGVDGIDKALAIIEATGSSSITNNVIYQQFLSTLDSISDSSDIVVIPGPAGPAGINGIIGRDGARGQDGIDGIDGEEGFPILGLQGIQGITGNNGPPGPAIFLEAESGEDGLMIPGVQGPQGSPGGDFWTNVIAASDQDVASNTVVATDAELFFTMTANKLYEYELHLLYSSPAGGGTPDMKFTFTAPATLTGQISLTMYVTTADSLTGTLAQAQITSVNQIGTAATPRLCFSKGWAFSTTGGSGSSGFQLQWAQNTSGINPTRRLAGSVLRYRQLSI